MKLNKEFLIHESHGETVLVPTGKAGFSGVVRGNKTFGAVVELLKKDTDEEKIVSAMKERFDAPEGAVEADVARILRELREIGALCE